MFLAASVMPCIYAESDTIMTDNVVEIQETVTDNGFVHPGIGFTAKSLITMREMVQNGVSPWSDYFEGMRRTRYAALDAPLKKQEQIKNDGGISSFADDAQTIWVHSILYFVTGNEEYRKLPVEAIKWYSERDNFFPEWFGDCHIKLGKYVRTFCEAAELMRYTEPNDKSLVVTDDMIKALDENCLKPMSDNALSRKTYFMNQHSYALQGYIAETVLANDSERYADAVEMTTVNSGNTENEARNGAIANIIRTISNDEETGEAVEPHLQLAEMGRDQDHAKGNIDNFVLLARTTENQRTKVDPQKGTISSALDAVSVMEFQNDAIINGSELFFAYNMGYDIPWTTIYSENNHKTDRTMKVAFYRAPAPGYHGRIMSTGTMAMYYRYKGLGYDMSKYPMLSYAASRVKESSRDNVLTGTYIDTIHNYDFDFWTDLNKEAADSDKDSKRAAEILAKDLAPYEAAPLNIIEIEDRFIDMNVIDSDVQTGYPSNTSDVPIEKGDGYARLTLKGADARTMALYNMDMPKNKLGLLVRTTDVTEFKLYSTNKYDGNEILTAYAPNTNGDWKYVIFDFSDGKVKEPDRQAIWYLTARSVSGNDETVDIDKLNTSESEINAIDLSFEDGESVSLLEGSEYIRNISAGGAAQYSVSGAADISVNNGSIVWTPQKSGKYEAYITAANSTTVNTKRIEFSVCDTVDEVTASILSGYDQTKVYTSSSASAVEAVKSGVDGTRSGFDALQEAVDSLELLNPPLRYGGIDYSGISECSSGTAAQNLVDNSAGSNITLSEPDMNITFDFGESYKVRADSFEIQPSDGFPARVLGSNVYGSDNGVDWTLLTSNAAEISDKLQKLDVLPEQKNKTYRFLRIYMPNGTNNINENAYIMGVGEFRINGERVEEHTPDFHKALITGDPDGIFRPDDNMTRAEAAVLLSRTVKSYMDNNQCSNAFDDVTEDAWYEKDLAYMAKKKYITADTDKNFRPDDSITRGEFCDFLVRFKGLKGDADTAFSDIGGNKNEKNIALAAREGLIEGYEDGTFRPDANITRAEITAIVCRMEKRNDNGGEITFSDVDSSHWAYDYIREAALDHFVK